MASNTLICELSGQSPIQDPVVTPTGQICSKKLLLQKLTETNYMNPFTTSSSNPIPLEESQLIEIQSGRGSEGNIIPPKPSTSNSIPSILNTLSSEYDSLVLELYDTRKALEETRKELSVALYQNDAAIRVIARVVLERDVARKQLADTLASGGSASNKRKRDDNAVAAAPDSKKVNVVEEDNDMKMKEDGDDGSQIPAEHSTQLQNKWSQLFSSRKTKTKAGPNHASLDAIAKFEASDKKYHKATNKGTASLVAPLASSTINDGEPVIVTGGRSDKQIIWYNATKHQIQKTDTLKKPILNSHCLSTYDNVTAAISSDHILHVYSGEDASSTLVLDNEDDIVGVCVHPTCEHVFVSTAGGKITLVHVKKDGNDSLSLEIVTTLNGLDVDGVKCTCMGLHPDGLILALGRSDGKVSVWDLKTEKVASTLEGSSDANASIQIMTFSEKGYHVAVSTEDGNIAIWDLRKQKKVTSIASNDEYKDITATALSFDPVGKFLAYGTSNGQIIVTSVKEWEKKMILENNNDDIKKKKKGPGKVTGLVWGVDAQSIVSSYEDDRVIKFWATSE